MEELIAILAIIAVIVVIIIIVRRNRKCKKETEELARKLAEAQAAQKAKEEAEMITLAEAQSEVPEVNPSTAKTLAEEVDNMEGETKESFTSIDTTNAKAKAGNVIVGPKLFTDGVTDVKFGRYVNAINAETMLDGDVSEQVAGASIGDNFGKAFENHMKYINSKKEGGSVKTNEEIANISKTLGVQSNNTSCMLTRGGATRAKLFLDPLGTAGVMDEDTHTERDKDHTIRMVSNVVHVPSFQLDTNNIGRHIVEERRIAQSMNPKQTSTIKVASTNPDETVTVVASQPVAETFRRKGFY
jgi:hypothetical protein